MNPTQNYVNEILNVDVLITDKLKVMREYTVGIQRFMITATQRERLGDKYPLDESPQVNICATIIGVESDRLKVLSQDVQLPPRTPENTDLVDELNDLLDSIWKLSEMDLVSDAFHFGSVRDGDGYLVVSWNAEFDQPEYHYNQAYNGTEGVHMVYSQPNNRKSAMYAFKVWETMDYTTGYAVKIRRLNVYWRNRIEFYVEDPTNRQWMPMAIEGSETVIGTDGVEFTNPFNPGEAYFAEVQWLTEDGTPNTLPLGIPVFHYPHSARGSVRGLSGIHDIAPGLQDDINNAHVSCIMASELTGTPINYATGYEAPIGTEVDSSGKLVLEIEAGGFLYTKNEAATFGQLGGQNISVLLEHKNDLIKNGATITGTPINFFNLTGQLPAEGTQDALQDTLVAKVKRAQKGIGTTYSQAAKYALKWIKRYTPEALVNSMQIASLTYQQIDRLEVITHWESPEPRANQLTLDEAEKKKNLGVPEKQLWREMGYGTDEIEDFEEDAKKKRNAALAAVSLAAQAQASENEARSNMTGQQPAPDAEEPDDGEAA